MISPSRTAAFQSLQKYQKSGIVRVINCRRKEDHKLAERIVYGVLQNGRFLDALLEGYIVSKPHHDVLLILKLSVYQLLFLDRVPASAVINDAVSLCKTNGLSFSAGFVNAVLRKIDREKHFLLGKMEFPAAVRWSHPDWMISRLTSVYSCDFVENFMQANQILPSVTLQVNTTKCGFSELLKLLQNANTDILDTSTAHNSIAVNSQDVRLLPGFHEGYFFIQDTAAHVSVQLAKIRNNMNVLDVCAAPGGKSIAAALLGGDVIACDISPKRIERCVQNFQRLGLSIPCHVQDATVYFEDYSHRFDVVIADVPCTGSGVIRKHPEIRYKPESDLIQLKEIQRCILSNVSRYVAPGGILIYSTCSVLPEEDEDQVQLFLSQNTDYHLEPVSLSSFSCENGMLRSWPHLNGHDGFFAAALRRNE